MTAFLALTAIAAWLGLGISGLLLFILYTMATGRRIL